MRDAQGIVQRVEPGEVLDFVPQQRSRGSIQRERGGYLPEHAAGEQRRRHVPDGAADAMAVRLEIEAQPRLADAGGANKLDDSRPRSDG